MKPEDVTDEMLDAAQAVADQASLFGDPWGAKRAVLAAAINAMPQTDAQAQIDAIKAERDALRKALVEFVHYADDCDDDSPESPQAIRNGKYMDISYVARAALANKESENAN